MFPYQPACVLCLSLLGSHCTRYLYLYAQDSGQGLEMELAAGGAPLSAGQKQLVALARALLQHSKASHACGCDTIVASQQQLGHCSEGPREGGAPFNKPSSWGQQQLVALARALFQHTKPPGLRPDPEP